jgi:hypothetical protein
MKVRFQDHCIRIVRDYVNAHLDKTDGFQITSDDVYVVWSCQTLQHFKALLSTNIPDGMYYEVTLNGAKAEFYLDAYKKFENQCIPLVDILIGRKEEQDG